MGEKRLRPESKANLKILWTSLVVGMIFLAVQVAGGIWSGSIAIFADSAHLASDNLGFVIAIVGINFAKKQSTETYSYGFHRAELVGTLTSIASIWVMTVWLFIEATKRVFAVEPPEVLAGIMFIVSVAGLFFNIIQLCVLGGHGHGHGHSHEGDHSHAADAEPEVIRYHPRDIPEDRVGTNMVGGHAHGGDGINEPLLGEKKPERNMQVTAAYLHVLGDLLSSVGVIIAAIVMFIWGDKITMVDDKAVVVPGKAWARYADPVCTYIFAALVLGTTIPLFRRCLHIMMEGTPDAIDPEALTRDIKNADADNICNVHDIHCWKLGGDQTSFTAHCVSHEPLETLNKVTAMLREKYNLNHTTVQVEGLDDDTQNKFHFACTTDMHADTKHDFHKDHK